MKHINKKCEKNGHEWKYNFPSLPNKAICKICTAKAILNLRTLEWNIVEKFDNESRTDKELIKNWT